MYTLCFPWIFMSSNARLVLNNFTADQHRFPASVHFNCYTIGWHMCARESCAPRIPIKTLFTLISSLCDLIFILVMFVLKIGAIRTIQNETVAWARPMLLYRLLQAAEHATVIELLQYVLKIPVNLNSTWCQNHNIAIGATKRQFRRSGLRVICADLARTFQ